MYALIDRKDVTPESVWFKIKAPEIAETCKAGQFIILRSNEKGERIPLTIADWNPEEGWISVIFQKVGVSTYELAEYQKGESLRDCAGPLGIPTHTENAGNTIVIGGGLGIAIATPVARAYKQAEISKWGTIVTDRSTGKTSKEGVYAGGDIATGAATVIAAMGAGKIAAKSIHKQIMGIEETEIENA